LTRIKVDIDGGLPEAIGDRIWWTLRTMKLSVRWISYRRTRHGWHVEIEVARRIHPWRVIAIQAVLGSDYRRETFNLRRTSQWSSLPAVARDHWNVLFSRKIHISL
jgi:hypothetical protein